VGGQLNAAGTKLVYGAQFAAPRRTRRRGAASPWILRQRVRHRHHWRTDFPTTTGAFQTTLPNRFDAAFVAKLNASEVRCLWHLFGREQPGVRQPGRVDAQGDAYVIGLSESADFPLTPGAFQTAKHRHRPHRVPQQVQAGRVGLVFSTYIDGAFGFSAGINPLFSVGSFDIDSAGDVFLTGQAGSGFPVTAGPLSRAWRAGPTSLWRVYAARQVGGRTYLGGSGRTRRKVIAVNPDGTVTVAEARLP